MLAKLLKMTLRAVARAVSLRRPPDVLGSIITYHKIGSGLGLELEVSESVFRRQMVQLSQWAMVTDVEALLVQTNHHQSGAVKVALTFDDAYSDFFTHAFPILREFGFPALLFVPTAFMGGAPPPISRPIPSSLSISPVSWDQINTMVTSGLVEIGAHSHSHRVFTGISDDEIREEIAVSNEIFLKYLGKMPRYFAYPRGYWDDRSYRAVEPYYERIFGARGGMVAARDARGALPRIPILASDGEVWFRSRVEGRLALEDRVVTRLRRMHK